MDFFSIAIKTTYSLLKLFIVFILYSKFNFVELSCILNKIIFQMYRENGGNVRKLFIHLDLESRWLQFTHKILEILPNRKLKKETPKQEF